MVTQYKRMKQKRATAANWASSNPVLLDGEIGVEKDTGKFKIGDGVSAWLTLPYIASAPEGTPTVFPIYGSGGFQEDSLLSVYPNDKLVWGGLSFSLWDPTFLNASGADAVIRIGNSSSYVPVITSGWKPLYFVDVEPIVEIHDTSTAINGGLFSVQAKNAPGKTNNVITGVSGKAYSYGNTIGGLNLKGVSGYAYVRSLNEIAGYGGYFEAFTGGNQSTTNSTPLWGIKAIASGGHNGITPQVWAGEFKVTTIGGGGVGSITDGRGVQITVDGSQPITDFGSIKGLSISGWVPVGVGRTWEDSYGIYIDDSIDQGTLKRYAILCESLSDSVFSGAVKGPINAYDATTWNGSAKFATEDAVRDKIEALDLASGLDGTGTIGTIPYFTTSTLLASMPATYDAGSGQYEWFHTSAADDEWRMKLRASEDDSGEFQLGNIESSEYGFLGFSKDSFELLTGEILLGNPYTGNETQILIDDSDNSVYTSGKLKFDRTVSGTPGAVIIDKAVGQVILAAGTTSIGVTCSHAANDSLIFVVAQEWDNTAKYFGIIRDNGIFTIVANAPATADLPIAFMVTN